MVAGIAPQNWQNVGALYGVLFFCDFAYAKPIAGGCIGCGKLFSYQGLCTAVLGDGAGLMVAE